MTPIRETLSAELAQWVQARHALAVAKRRASEAPDDAVRRAQMQRADLIARETTDMLRAALHAHGYSLEQLQHELRSGA